MQILYDLVKSVFLRAGRTLWYFEDAVYPHEELSFTDYNGTIIIFMQAVISVLLDPGILERCSCDDVEKAEPSIIPIYLLDLDHSNYENPV